MGEKLKKYISRFSICIGLFIYFLIIFITAFILLVKTQYVQQQVLDLINKDISGQIFAEKIKFSLIQGKIEIQNVSIKDNSKNNILSFERFNFQFDWPKLFDDTLFINNLTLKKPNINLLVSKDNNQLNLINALLSTKSSKKIPEIKKEENTSKRVPFNIIIKKLDINNASLNFNDSKGLNVFIKNTNILASTNLKDFKANLKLNTPYAYINYKKSKLKIKDFQTETNLNDKLAKLNLKTKINSGDLNLIANIDLKKAFPKGFMSYKKNLDLITYNLSLQQKDFSLKNIFLDNDELSGKLDVNAKINGRGITLNKLNCTTTIDIIAKQIKKASLTKPVDFNFKTKILNHNNIATIEYLDANYANSYLKLNGSYNISTEKINTKLNLKIEELSTILNTFDVKDVKGKLSILTDIKGSIKQPTLNAKLHGTNLHFKGNDIGDLDLNLNFSNGKLFADKIQILNKRSNLNITGFAQILKPNQFVFIKNPSFNLKILQSTIFLDDFIKKLKGKLNISADLKGTIKNPNGDLTIKGKNLEIFGQNIYKVLLSTDIKKDKIFIKPLKVSIIPDEIIKATGVYSLNKSFKIHLKSKGISINSIKTIKNKHAFGKIIFDLMGTGTTKSPKINGSINLKHLKLDKKPLQDISIKLNADDKFAKINCNLINTNLNAIYNFITKDISAFIKFDNTKLAPYFEIAGQKNFNGLINGTIKIQSNADKLKRSNASIDFLNFDLSYKKNKLIYFQNCHATLKNEKLNISDLNIKFYENGYLNIRGNGSLNGQLQFNAKGKIPLSIASYFTNNLPDIKGDLALSARLNGTILQPDINSEIDFNNISFTVPEIRQNLHKFNGKIIISPKLVSLIKLNGQLDTGKFFANGDINHRKFKPVKANINFIANNLPINIPNMLNAKVNIKANLQGTDKKSSIDGKITLLDGLYFKDVNINLLNIAKEITRDTRKVTISPKKSDIDFIKNLKFNLNLTRRGVFQVENNLADLQIAPDIKISGNLKKPNIEGIVKVLAGGQIHFLGNDFTINKGKINFINPYKIEPSIDIKSEVTVKSWNIYLDISGTPDQLVFKLSSIPAEQQGDIISILVFGRTTAQLVNGEGGSVRSTQQLLAELISSTYGENIKKFTGMDVFKINTTDKNDDSKNYIQVTMGKNLTDRLQVLYSIETKNGQLNNCVTSKYKLLDNISVQAFQDTQGNTGGELIYRLEFR